MKAQLILIQAILETLETEKFIPLGPLYVSLNIQLDLFNSILELLEKSNAIVKTSETMERGKNYNETLEKINNLLKGK